MRLIIIIILLSNIGSLYYGQSKKISKLFRRCENPKIVDTLSNKIKFPNSDRYFYLQESCQGTFSGELPSLFYSDTSNVEKPIKLKAIQVWNSSTKEYYYNDLKSIHSDISRFKYLNHDFFLYKSENNRLKLCFHVDDSKDSDNLWMWIFEFYIPPSKFDKEIVCKLNFVIQQIVEESDKIQNN